MNLYILNNREELFASQQQWDTVAQDHAFSSWAWNAHWLRSMENGQAKPFVIVGLDDDGNWQAIAPFCIVGRKLRMLGSGTACTDYVNLIDNGQDRRVFADTIVEFLTTNISSSGQLSEIDLIEIEGGAANDEDLNYFCKQLESEFSIHEIETEGTWKVQLPQSVDQLNGILKSSCRRKVRKARKRLAADDTNTVFADAASFEELWFHFVQLHQARRNHLGQEGCFADPAFETFLKSAARDLFDRELAELFVIYKSGKPLASQLLLISGESCMMYQTGVDPNCFSEEPGYQAIVVALDHAISRGATFYDFLRGDEAYKSRWSTTREAIIKRRFAPKRLSATLKHNCWVAGYRFKQFAKSFLNTSAG